MLKNFLRSVIVLYVFAGFFLSAACAGEKEEFKRQEAGVTPILSSTRISARRLLIKELYNLKGQKDFRKEAFLNSILAQEAFQRAYRALKAWEKIINNQSQLLPRGTADSLLYWNSKDTAADLFPFMFLASSFLDKGSEKKWLKMIDRERELCGEMPCAILFNPMRLKRIDAQESIYGAAEYAKDGLLAITERVGREGIWFTRMEEIEKLLIDKAAVYTQFGKLSSSLNEVNGEMLNVLTRLYWATQNETYLTMAERIADAYLFEIIPHYKGLPPDNWSLVMGRPRDSNFMIRAHGGNEMVSGLTELYFLEKLHGRPKYKLYEKPLKDFLDLLLQTGRNSDGLWYNIVDSQTREVVHNGIIDTFGYLLNAYQMFDLANNTSFYADEIRRMMKTVATYKSYPWEGEEQDGYADCIESMLYLLPWFDILECHQWVDDEIEVLFAKQFDSGFIEGYYLDGNFTRTTLLYAQYKTQGVLIEPWREDLRVGASYDKNKKELYVYISADNPWKGVLKFDAPRHSIIWNMPFNYPRLNATPEWFVAWLQKSYRIIDLESGKELRYKGQELVNGIEIDLLSPRSLKVIEK